MVIIKLNNLILNFKIYFLKIKFLLGSQLLLDNLDNFY